jgi:Family of unknown function (DUF6152)
MSKPLSLCMMLPLLTGTSSAWPHHSYAIFDAQKLISLDATVKEFQWTNPHSWLHVVVLDDNGVLSLVDPSEGRRVESRPDAVCGEVRRR